ncbi:MAG: lamin tail domain-containing protein [Anaerolineae bacterium]|nr:lamin tail domain-containing protein [Anaerolineae bacterium]
MQLRNILIAAAAVFITAASVLLFFYPTPEIQTATAGGVTPDVFNYLPMVVKPAEPTATPTATIVPTATTPPANVQITLIVYNPAGDDVAGEYVRIENKGGVTAVLTGWTLSDNDSHVYNFPGGFSLAPGAAVQVWTKSGANSATNLYWGSGQAIWNNTGDTAYLRNGGTLVDSCSYGGGGVQASC